MILGPNPIQEFKKETKLTGACQPIGSQSTPLLRISISQALDAITGIQANLRAWVAELVVEKDVEKGTMNLQCIASAIINKP